MAKARRFNAFSGVFTPSILTILGVIMFLRLPWIVGQAGLLATLGIILVAHIISGSTGLSVASIATDKRVETGGTYFIISRSLGLPIGGTLGWALFIGLSFSVSLYLIGFAEVFLGYFGFEVSLYTIRIAGSIILLLVAILTFISTSLAIKTQYIILTAMLLSLLSVFLGSHEYSPATGQMDAIPGSLSWIALFAIFFPAVTGFEAGVSMSGDLKDPKKDIPLGTISAILVGLIVYTGLSVFLSFTVSSDILVNDPNVLFVISLVPQLVIAGILGATLSSALGSILGAPRILQAVARDSIAPGFFSKGFGASNEPRNALILTYLIAQTGILIGELNAIARIVTIFFIITYGFLNITYTVESWASSDFRPSFKIPRFVSIIGSIACIVVMIQLDIVAMAFASLALIGLFFYLKNKELSLQTGDTLSSIWLSLVRTGLLKLSKTRTNPRNWRPNVILFSGGAHSRPHLIEIGKVLVGKLGIFTSFELIEHPEENLLFDKTASVTTEDFGKHKDIITRRHVCRNLYEGIEMISRVYGFSGFEPNTILMGWAKNTKDPKRFQELLLNLKKLDFNLAFLSYNKERGFGDYKRIDFWWSGKGRNLPLALHFIRFITATHDWRHSEVRILAIARESKNTDRYYNILSQTIANFRINADIKVLRSRDKLHEREIIKSETLNTDLTISELPEFNVKNIDDVIHQVNEASDYMGTCLFVNASKGFEEINVVSEIAVHGKSPEADKTERKPVTSFVYKLQLSKIDIIYNEVYNLALLLEASTKTLIENIIFSIPESREKYIEQLLNLSDKTTERLTRLNSIKSENERNWESLKILNDFSYHANKQLEAFKNTLLKNELENIHGAHLKYISETEKRLALLPTYIHLKFGRHDYKSVKARGLLRKINKTGALLWLNIFGGNIGIKIKVHPAARYFIYYKRLEYFKQFFEDYTLQSMETLTSVKYALTSVYELIEKIKDGKLNNSDIAKEKKSITTALQKIQDNNKDFVYAKTDKLLNEICSDIENFSRIIESPVANSLSRKFKSFDKKNTELENTLKPFPDFWLEYMARFTNKAQLDYIYLSLKNRIATKIEKAYQDIEVEIEGNIHSKLKIFENQILSTTRSENASEAGKGFISPKSVKPVQLDYIFNELFREIRESVEELPENMEILEDVSEKVSFSEILDNPESFQVAVRKTADFYISNELRDKISKQSIIIGKQLNLSLSAFKDLIKLANFQFDNGDVELSENDENGNTQKENTELIQNLLKNIEKEEITLREQTRQIKENLYEGLRLAFEPLSSAIIIKTSSGLKKKTREAEKVRISGRLYNLRKNIKGKISDQLVALLYRQSEGILWADRLDKSYKDTEYQSELSLSNLPGKLSPIKPVLQNLPFYYSNLFSGSSNIGEDFWVGMENEVEKGSIAIKRFTSGAKGLLIVSGDRSSGKSSLCKYLARLHFQKENIINVRAPRESYASIELFDKTLLSALKGQNELAYHLNQLPPGSVILINDLELWWERKPFGTQVIERIITLMQENSNRILFIVNINKHALNILNKLTSINTWAIDIVFCQAFDARELKDLILARHQAGGMKFVMNGKHESNMTKWDYARLFNRFFKLSFGNPGYAINLWLAGIRKISGNTLYMESPPDNYDLLQKNIPPDEVLIILQFILHRRFSVRSLSEILKYDYETTDKTLRVLLQKGIVIEKFPEVFSLNPALENHLVKKLKSLELL